jgi:hypothetical protein
MLRKLSVLALLSCLALAGCGSGEIAPTTEKHENITKEQSEKVKQDSLNKMPADARAHYQQQMTK